MLRILIQNRHDAREIIGGDTVQMDETADFLRSQGHQVNFSFDDAPDLEEVDVVHLFNLTRPVQTYRQACNARRQTTPYFLSPVYWDLQSVIPWKAYEFPRSLRMLVSAPFLQRRLNRDHLFRDVKQLQSKTVSWARCVFPSSVAEERHLQDRLACSFRTNVVQFGIRVPTHPSFDSSPSARHYFLCLGGIGPRKNQLGLVKAFRNIDAHLLIVGNASPGCDAYDREVRRLSGPNVEFRPAVSHDEVGLLFAQAIAVVQPSYIETPGLVAMEAAACGLPIVVADVPPVREYFGASDSCHYCDPSDARSIARACEMARDAGRGDGKEFSHRHQWDQLMTPMADAYEQLEAELARRPLSHARMNGA